MPNATELLHEYDRASRRLSLFGVDLGKGRFSAYRKALLAARAATGEQDLPDAKLLRAVICELEDLCAISGLPAHLLSKNRFKLRTIVRGHPMYCQEGKDDPGRQEAFPFYVARQFREAGAIVRLEKPSDVWVECGALSALVECKRVNSDGALARRIVEAYRQIAKHRAKGHSGYGIVAIEVTRVANPALHGYGTATVDEALDGLHVIVERAFERCQKTLQRYLRQVPIDAKVDVILYRFQAVVETPTYRQACCCSWRIESKLGLVPPEPLRRLFERLPGFQPGLLIMGQQNAGQE